jgi:hypothetical protein
VLLKVEQTIIKVNKQLSNHAFVGFPYVVCHFTKQGWFDCVIFVTDHPHVAGG